MRGGVYEIAITGTPFVYIGEATDIDRRWQRHYNEWVWPNDATFRVLVEMPDSSKADRLRVEAEQIKKAKSAGKRVLGMSASEAGRANIIAANAARTKEERIAHSERARASITPASIEKRRASMITASALMSPEQKAARSAKLWATRRARREAAHV